MAEKTGDPRSRSYLTEIKSVTVQSGNGKMVD